MGRDATFHLVDLPAIREKLVPKLLGEPTPPTPLDEHHPRAAERWEAVRAALRDRVFCCVPPVPIRAWRRVLASRIQPTFRIRGRGEPGAFVRARGGRVYPRLAGKFPERFDSNGMTGALIPTSETLSAARWLEAMLAREAPDAAWAGLA
jgi:hypothetical protein